MSSLCSSHNSILCCSRKRSHSMLSEKVSERNRSIHPQSLSVEWRQLSRVIDVSSSVIKHLIRSITIRLNTFLNWFQVVPIDYTYLPCFDRFRSMKQCFYSKVDWMNHSLSNSFLSRFNRMLFFTSQNDLNFFLSLLPIFCPFSSLLNKLFYSWNHGYLRSNLIKNTALILNHQVSFTYDMSSWRILLIFQSLVQ